MEHKRKSRRCSSAGRPLHGFVLVLCIALMGLRAESSNSANGLAFNARRLEMAEKPGQLLGSRKLMQQENAQATGNTLKLKMVHRNAMDSPARKHFGSREEEIQDFIAMDEMRVKGLYGPVSKAAKNKDGDGDHEDADDVASLFSSPSLLPPLPLSDDVADQPVPSSAPEPSNIEEFQGRVFSGASFPGNIGQYFVEFSIGTPPQPFLFIADTGSDLLWVPCSLCTHCNAKNSASTSNTSIFLSGKSSTFDPITCSSQECGLIPPPPNEDASCSAKNPTSCTYGYGYSDTSETTGIFGYDTVTMTTSSGKKVEIKNVAFGCGTNNSGPSITELGGVIGLGQGPISFTSQVGYMYGNKFSYCFTSFFQRKASSTIVFGDDLMGTELKAPLQYTPFVANAPSDTFYYVSIKGVEVSGKRLPILSLDDVFTIKTDGSGGAVIDSGTTLSFFVQPAYEAIVEAIDKAMQLYPLAPPTAGLPTCYNVSGFHNPQLPQLTIVFEGGATFKPPTKNYFLSPRDELRCLGVLASPAVGGLTILGNLLQQNYHVEYDRLNNRLGFAKARCSL